MKHIGLTIILCLTSVAAWSQDTSPTANAPLEFILHPVQEGIGRYLYYHALEDTEVVFKKEPVYAGDTVYRHILRFGKDNENFVGFAFDVKADKLYLDKNRNLDLTDDEPYINTEEEPYRDTGSFKNVQIEITYENISVQYALDMQIYKEYFLSGVRSGWQGEIEIAGKKCMMRIGDNMDGIFDGQDVFMFDHERHREVRLSYGEEDMLRLPQWIFFEGQSYTITPALRTLDGETVLAVTLTPITQNLMDISFEGQYVSRVVLRDREYQKSGIIDWPQPVMRIPAESYYLSQVDLLDSFCGYPRTTRMITPGANTQIKVGGPVKQEIAATRSGSVLSLDYSLLGVDNIKYSADSYSNRATFAIYQGDKKVEGGDFEYG